MATVYFNITGVEKIKERYARAGEKIGSEEVMGEVGEVIKTYNEKTWGRGVKDLPSTDRRWPQHGKLVNPEAAEERGYPVLKETFRIKEVTPISVTYGSDDFRAHFLQYGTSKMSKKRILKMPRKRVKAALLAAIVGGRLHSRY